MIELKQVIDAYKNQIGVGEDVTVGEIGDLLVDNKTIEIKNF